LGEMLFVLNLVKCNKSDPTKSIVTR